MSNFNFFEPYIEEPKKTSTKRLILISVTTIIVFALIFYPASNYFEIKRISEDIAFMEEVLNLPENQNKLKLIEDKKESLESLKSDFERINILNDEIKKIDVVNDDLLVKISKKIPEGILFESMNIVNNQIEIQGTAYTKYDIAQLVHNLRNIEELYEIFIPSIVEQDLNCNFFITLKLKDVNENDIK